MMYNSVMFFHDKTYGTGNLFFVGRDATFELIFWNYIGNPKEKQQFLKIK